MCFPEVSGLALGKEFCLSEPILFEKILLKCIILNQQFKYVNSQVGIAFFHIVEGSGSFIPKMVELAQKQLATAKKKFPGSTLLDPDDVRAIYLVNFDPNLYHEFAVASARNCGITRQAALQKMFRPLTGIVSRLG